jgi:hypothetical protein
LSRGHLGLERCFMSGPLRCFLGRLLGRLLGIPCLFGRPALGYADVAGSSHGAPGCLTLGKTRIIQFRAVSLQGLFLGVCRCPLPIS